MKLCKAEFFDYSCLKTVEPVAKTAGNNGGTKRTYADIICSFDIETSRLPFIHQSAMYIWQMAISEKYCIYGRTWEEWKQTLAAIDENLPQGLTLIIFVHNLAYEFQFISDPTIYDFKPEEVFAVKSRQVLRADMGKRFEFRCSYLLTNMSLDALTHKYGVIHGKLSGAEFDYNKIRLPWSQLTPYELAYCVNDVIGLVEVIAKILDVMGDNLATLPLTSTGFVRRDVKRAMHSRRKWVQSLAPDMHLFTLANWAFRGGDTHANRHYTGKVIEDMHSCDLASSYPASQMICKFPCTPFLKSDAGTETAVNRQIHIRHRAMLLHLEFTELTLKNKYWCDPYLPRSKCLIEGGVYDNGRVLRADKLETCITDIDYRILQTDYKWQAMRVIDAYYSKYDYLPPEYTAVIKGYYNEKTALKGIDGQELYYMKAKNKLNAIYGMSVTNPCKVDILYNGEGFSEDDNPDLPAILAKSNKRAFSSYFWGVWTTAHSRYELHQGLWMVGSANAVYWDTDSIKYVGDYTHEFEIFNARRRRLAIEREAFATDKNGMTHHMGVFEQEDDMALFKTLGAKKYMYTLTKDGSFHITIAGVNKRIGAIEFLSRAGESPLWAMEDVFLDCPLNPVTLTESGGMESVYNDRPEITEIECNGIPLRITKNLCLEKSCYTIGITQEYKYLLSMSADEWADIERSSAGYLYKEYKE